MSDEEFWLIMEAKQQSMGKLTYQDHESIREFFESGPKISKSIRHGKER